ncbi:tetratricopeptide repeat-containing protein [Xenorhabdus sp. DI]|uniref:invasion regulator SirB1 n=1 Tax=Xenorhabdus TaxID=626 RepID=UPI00198A65E8|nr:MULTISPECIES: invasion regulator SirB1 [unclassified Xenorhabdus]MBD2785915.1 tetratricopeptide repeat-containing protein [Xenorhabdus sp. 3]MBD2789572.1 tetratricopeptide repeat-containing protein [Xenorhabdus sp. DI]MBD2794931.1 tetratricopeptide repeat-containing protein [Xenorhabdus sp. 18]MDC9580537.1 invasion regulator SirB1 [Xenorhabdus sp. PR6a]
MKTIVNYEFNNASLIDGIILVTRAIRPDFPQTRVTEQLTALIEEARQKLSSIVGPKAKLQSLLTLFYREWKFGGANGVYCLSDTLWLDSVLHSHQGAPVALGTVFAHIAQTLELPVQPVIFPTQLILRVDLADEPTWFINPMNGDTLNEHILDVWLKGNIGPMVRLENKDLQEADNISIVRKVTDTIKVSLMEEKKMELALKASEVVLMFDPEDPYEIRDRGLIYAQLDCNHIAVSDLSYFVEHCPEDPISEMIKMQINTIEQRSIILH